MRLAYDALERFIDFKDKKILEIGGNSNCESAFPFLQAGAAHIIVSGLDDIVAAPPAEIVNANIEIVHADARDLTSTFECDQFDIVYGISVIEHIDQLPLALSQIKSATKPGGLIYLQGNPIWSGPIGHHVWITPYHNQSEGTYTFMKWPGDVSSISCNPIPDWGHLLMSPSEMEDHLLSIGIPPRDVIMLIDSIYFESKGTSISRLSFTDIASAIAASGLITLAMDVSEDIRFPGSLPAEERIIALGSEKIALQELQRRFGAAGNYKVTGVEYVLMKSHA